MVRWFALVLVLAALGLAACGDDGDESGTATTSADTGNPGDGSEEIVIRTRLNLPTGEILTGSSIGDSPFCPGGTFEDGRGSRDFDFFVDRTIRCPDGTLRLGFSPGEPEKGHTTQSGPWKIVSGTGAYEDFEGHGVMKAVFESAQSMEGRERFTGTVGP
jgi:hypothetical protein